MHLVFWDNSTYRTFSEAAKGDRGIAAVALLFQVGIIFCKHFPGIVIIFIASALYCFLS